ncbi:MAG: UDP-N-acetylmuramoyl-tripeptide--D-alanyl-D-alanine ligase [Oscillospiraceae bacterium]
MQELSLSEIAHALGCHTNVTGAVTAIVTDSRAASPGTLFVAIVGDHLDGNDFASDALAKGAPLVVVSRLTQGVDPDRALVVNDTKRALIAIGGAYRAKFSLPIVGVTGSVGKTTTKEFVYAVLSARYHTHKNEGNQNNELGVPNTLFGLTPKHEVAVVELGMSGPGEIHDLAMAVRPSVGVITAIGVSHIEQLGSRENILKAKLELLDALPADAPLFVCGDNDLLAPLVSESVHIYRYGITNAVCDLRASSIEQQGNITRFEIDSPWGKHAAVIPTVGQHNVLDALAAFGVGCVMGVEPEKAAAALKNYQSTGMRQKVELCRGCTVVEDCYNASPDSLRAAILALAAYPCEGRRILVLSDMLELGRDSPKLHRECGAFAARQGIDLLLACGELSLNTIEGAEEAGLVRSLYYTDKKTLAEGLLQAARTGDVVWFKASRAMELEDVIARFYQGGDEQ